MFDNGTSKTIPFSGGEMDPWNQVATDDELIRALAVYRNVSGAGLRRQLELIAEADRRKLWRDDGAEDAAAWVATEFQISRWAAAR